jgi:20S proteasome alpha/beta subunit
MQRDIDLKTIEFRTLDLEQSTSLKYIGTSQSLNKLMTTVVAFKSSDGIILASDSQASNDTMKNLEVGKIFQINDSMGLAGAGDIGHISVLVDELKQQLEIRKYNTELELREVLDNTLCQLFRKYDVERSERLGFSKTVFLFEPSAMVGAKLNDGTFALYRLRFPPWVYPIDEYDAIGSGELYAKLIIRQQRRIIPYGSDTLDYNAWISMLTINEIKTFDTDTGGITQVTIINKDGLRQLSRDEAKYRYNQYREYIVNKIAENVGITKERAMRLFPEP